MTSGRLFLRIVILCAIAALGASLGVVIGLPVPLLTGPALLATAASLAGLPVTFPIPFRNCVFLLAGITIGAAVSRESLAALATWPLAFTILAGALVAMLLLGQWVLSTFLGSDRATGLLATTPGHLSYVVAMGEEAGLDSRHIVIVQSVRIFALTMFVPFAARWMGVDTGIGVATGPGVMSPLVTGAAILGAIALSPLLSRARLPAPMLMAGMIVGAALRVSEVAEGGLAQVVAFPTLALIGTLIGSRFVGMKLGELKRWGGAGLLATSIAAGGALIASFLAAPIVGMPVIHVLVAFAPGGLETMAVMGAAIGANPGFVAAAHVLRLVILSALVPILLARARRHAPPTDD